MLKDLKMKLPQYLAAIGVHLMHDGSRLIGRCPAHRDANPSFAVFGDDHAVCGCYPCDFTGDVFAVSRWLKRSSSFPEAVREVAGTLGMPVPGLVSGPLSSSVSKTSAVHREQAVARKRPKRAVDIQIIKRARERFIDAYWDDDALLLGLSKDLGIGLPTLWSVNGSGSGLGLATACGGATGLCYIYPSGLKWRNPDPNAKLRFLWLTGSANAPWRAEQISDQTETVYLTESESDCLALIDAGLEKDGTTVCVASPGTSFQREWADILVGKRVVIAFDPDRAGREATIRVAECLNGKARSIEVLNLTNPETNER